MGASQSVEEASTTTSTSPLLNLPPEIKDKIYHYAHIADKPLDLCKKSFRTHYAFLNTCTQARKEATAIFYSQNVFVVSNIGSESLNLIKNADYTITKLQIAFTISKDTRQRCKNDRVKIIKYLKPRAEQLPAFLLTWVSSTEGIEIINPEDRRLKQATDRGIISALNTSFQRALDQQSGPFDDALRKMARIKTKKFVEEESQANGEEHKVGLKGKEFSLKAVQNLVGGEGSGPWGMGVEKSKLIANSSIAERLLLAKDTVVGFLANWIGKKGSAIPN